MQKLPPKEVLYKNVLHFKIGDICSLDEIKKKLVNLGYVRCDLIEAKGQFSIRGGILDISISEKIGVRIEFWGDEIDSIRNFAIVSQRSINTLEKAEIYPAHEYILDRNIEDVCKEIRKQTMDQEQQEIVEEDIEQILAGNYISKIDKYFDCFYSKTETLFDYLSERYIIAFDEERKIEQRTINIKEDQKNLINNIIEKQRIVPQVLENMTPYEEIENILEAKKRNVIYLEKQDIITNKQAERYEFEYREVHYYKSEIDNLFQELKESLKQKKSIF